MIGQPLVTKAQGRGTDPGYRLALEQGRNRGAARRSSHSLSQARLPGWLLDLRRCPSGRLIAPSTVVEEVQKERAVEDLCSEHQRGAARDHKPYRISFGELSKSHVRPFGYGHPKGDQSHQK